MRFFALPYPHIRGRGAIEFLSHDGPRYFVAHSIRRQVRQVIPFAQNDNGCGFTSSGFMDLKTSEGLFAFFGCVCDFCFSRGQDRIFAETM